MMVFIYGGEYTSNYNNLSQTIDFYFTGLSGMMNSYYYHSELKNDDTYIDITLWFIPYRSNLWNSTSIFSETVRVYKKSPNYGNASIYVNESSFKTKIFNGLDIDTSSGTYTLRCYDNKIWVYRTDGTWVNAFYSFHIGNVYANYISQLVNDYPYDTFLLKVDNDLNARYIMSSICANIINDVNDVSHTYEWDLWNNGWTSSERVSKYLLLPAISFSSNLSTYTIYNQNNIGSYAISYYYITKTSTRSHAIELSVPLELPRDVDL